MDKVIKQIADYFNIGRTIRVSRFGNGLINDTFLVTVGGGDKYVLQRLHKIFGTSLMRDIDAITDHLDKKGFMTPRLIRTKNGNTHTMINDDCWRMITFIPGKCFERGVSPSLAFSSAALVGKFHAILSNFDYKFKHKIKDFHDIDARIKTLKKTLKKFKNTEKYKKLYSISLFVINNYSKMEKMRDLPDRIIHGDLKINNIRFDVKAKNAVSLLDLDTMAKHKVVMDLGGAARTWCNGADEGDIKNSSFDLRVFKFILAGYLSTARSFITREEILAIPRGIESIILELSARFITDAFRESYFRLDKTQYQNLFEQNYSKARAQIHLYKDFKSKEDSVIKLIDNSCKQLF